MRVSGTLHIRPISEASRLTTSYICRQMLKSIWISYWTIIIGSKKVQQIILLLYACLTNHAVSSPIGWNHWVMQVWTLKFFSAHSTRGASASAVASNGISVADILKMVDWSQEILLQAHKELTKSHSRPQQWLTSYWSYSPLGQKDTR